MTLDGNAAGSTAAARRLTSRQVVAERTACFASPEGQAAASDVANFATGGATMLVTNVVAGQ